MKILNIICAVVVVVYALLPRDAVSWLRNNSGLFGSALDFLEAAGGPMNIPHVLAFFVLAVLVIFGIDRNNRGMRRRASFALLLLAGVIELLQLVIPGRSALFGDFFSSSLGVIAAMLVCYFYGHFWRKPINPYLRKAKPSALSGARVASLLTPSGKCQFRNSVEEVFTAGLVDEIRVNGFSSIIFENFYPELESVPRGADFLRLHANAKRATVNNLNLLARAREIQVIASAHQIEVIWLKGVALASWLYRNATLREFCDIDLLCATHEDAVALARALEKSAYSIRPKCIAGDLYVYEFAAISVETHVVCDVHWRLVNSVLFAERLSWAELSGAAQSLPLIGEGARGLSATHALLHACMHRAMNLQTGSEGRLCWLYDVHLLCGVLNDRDWQAVQELAIDRRLAGVCLAAVRSAQQVFYTTVPAEVKIGLEAASAREWLRPAWLGNWFYFQCACLCSISKWKDRFRWMQQMLIGDMTHLRERYGADGASDLVVVKRRMRDGISRIGIALRGNRSAGR